MLTRWNRENGVLRCEGTEDWSEPPRLSAVYNAMMLGLRDYVVKNRFPGVVLGMSGGIDSALTAAVAVDALGPERTRGSTPIQIHEPRKSGDAADSARLLGMRLDTVEIGSTVAAAEAALADVFRGRSRDVTRRTCRHASAVSCSWALEQARRDARHDRQQVQMSVGYATSTPIVRRLPVLKDIHKTEVYALSRWRNENCRRARGARRKSDSESSIQGTDSGTATESNRSGSLPPYDALDRILNGLVEEELSVEEIVARGFPRETVVRIQHLLYWPKTSGGKPLPE